MRAPRTPMDTPEAPTFGQVLRRLRLAAGTSQQALADGAGLSARRISDMERGLRRTPRASTIERLARALSVAQSEFTSPDGRSEAIHNSSNELSSFVGRHEELAQLTHLLPTTRLLTLAGPGGIGKTRLALRVASAVLADYPHGVWLVELAALANPDLVADRVAEVLAPGDREDATPIQRLVTVLGNKQLLLVLDNCEHMLAECAALVVTLLRACGGLRVLATSREPLAITGEVTWRVPSLSLPDLRLPLQHDALARSDAAQLLIARVSAQQPNFPTGQANTTAIVEVCRRLDGIPLALELAAAHVPTLGLDGVVRRLDDRFRLLVGGDRAAPTRHQTLRATIDWSYALLEQPERALLDRFSVFAGGGGLDAVESVCQGQDAAARVLESSAVLPLLERLIAQSLMIAEPDPAGGMRYHLLETVRAYAWERLVDARDTARVQRLHASYFTEFAERAEPELNRAAQASWLDRLEHEHDNLRTALTWTLEHDVEVGLRLGAALARFWFVRGHLYEGSSWLDQLLDRSSDATSSAARANALTTAGILAWHRADTDQAEAHLRASLALRGESSHDPRVSRTLYELAKVFTQRGDRPSARLFGERALERWRRDGDSWGTAVALNFLGELLREERDLVAAAGRYDESRQLFERAGDQRGRAIATQNLGIVATEQGDFERARALHRATLPWKLELGDREGLAASLVNMAYLTLRGGNAARAARLCGVAELACERIGAVLPSYERSLAERTIEEARGVLGTAAFTIQWVTGRRLSLDEAVAQALAPETDASDVSPTVGGLTPRQLEVVNLVARGRTNRDIAEHLIIAKSTADRHVSDILSKLNLRTRLQLATWAIEHGLRPDLE